MTLAETKIIYQALNQDLSNAFVESKEQPLSRKLCHIGQPVGVCVEGGGLAGALRISSDARLISQSWFEGREGSGHQQLDWCGLQIDMILQKLDLIRTHFDTLASKV